MECQTIIHRFETGSFAKSSASVGVPRPVAPLVRRSPHHLRQPTKSEIAIAGAGVAFRAIAPGKESCLIFDHSGHRAPPWLSGFTEYDDLPGKV